MKTAIVVAALLASTSARAYIPPTAYLLQRWVEIRVDRKLTSFKVVLDTAAQGRAMTDTIWYVAPFKVRSERVDGNATHVEIRDGNKRRVEDSQTGSKVLAAPIDPIAELFSSAEQSEPPPHERLSTHLKSLGIDFNKHTLTRFDGRVAILIGADPWDVESPQLWLDKDGLFPLRVIYRRGQGASSTLVDVRLLGYGSAKGATWYPEVIETYHNNVLVERSTLREIEIAPKIEPKQFRVK